MGFQATQWVSRLPGKLKPPQYAILWRVAWSCLDDTGFLPRSNAWLAEKCGMSERSLERHLPQLAKLNLVIRGDNGFRLPRFVGEFRQIGGGDRQSVRQTVRQNGGAYKERFYGNVGERESDSPFPSDSPDFKLSRSNPIVRPVQQNTIKGTGEKQELDPDILRKIWAPIQRNLRSQIEPNSFRLLWSPLRLVSVNFERLLVLVPYALDPELQGLMIRLITREAEATGMLRERRVELQVVVEKAVSK